MGILKRMASDCSVCPYKDNCHAKRMEACGYYEEEATQEIIEPIQEELLLQHDYRNIKISGSQTITIDLEDMRKRLEKQFYKNAGLGIFNSLT